MTEKIGSAGVYLSENDQTYSAPGQALTGLAIVGPTSKGQAFVPTRVGSYAEFTALFGADGSTSYVPQAAFSYFQTGASALVTRVLGNGGWSFSSTKQLSAIVSGSTIITVFHPSQNAQPTLASLNSTFITGSYGNFTLTLSGSQVYTQISGSLTPTDPKYIVKQLGSDASYQTGSAYGYLHFPNYFTGSVSASSLVSFATSSTAITFTSSYAEGYANAATPWVVNEAGVRLFRFVHRSAGFLSNKDVKVAITNINVGTDPTVDTTFDIQVRAWNDTDAAPSIIEQFRGVTLAAELPNYIGTVIGNLYNYYDSITGKVVESGDYVNKSNYIRVDIAPGVAGGTLPNNIYPNGHEAILEPIAGFGSFKLPAAKFISSNTGSSVYSGFNYAESDNVNYLNPLPIEAGVGNNVAFTKPVNDNKFVLPFQGGTDGMSFSVIKKIGANIATDGTNVFGFDLSTANTGGTSAFRKALDILSNNEMYSFDVLTLPGVLDQYHTPVTSYADSMVATRTDAVYIRDLVGVNESVATAVSTAAGIDSNYSATYYPWVKVRDTFAAKDMFVPPSVVIPQAIAYSDKVGAEWLAAAGLNRGGIGGAIDTKNRLSKAERDVLYAGRINPIAKFPGTGVVAYGQKTLQIKSTSLNRLSVRRCLIALRRYIGNYSKNLVFEPNTTVTRNKFLNVVNPYLADVQQKQGIYAYTVVMDETLNTQDVINRDELVGKVYIYPVHAAEYIILEFNLQPGTASFNVQ